MLPKEENKGVSLNYHIYDYPRDLLDNLRCARGETNEKCVECSIFLDSKEYIDSDHYRVHEVNTIEGFYEIIKIGSGSFGTCYLGVNSDFKICIHKKHNNILDELEGILLSYKSNAIGLVPIKLDKENNSSYYIVKPPVFSLYDQMKLNLALLHTNNLCHNDIHSKNISFNGNIIDNGLINYVNKEPKIMNNALIKHTRPICSGFEFDHRCLNPVIVEFDNSDCEDLRVCYLNFRRSIFRKLDTFHKFYYKYVYHISLSVLILEMILLIIVGDSNSPNWIISIPILILIIYAMLSCFNKQQRKLIMLLVSLKESFNESINFGQGFCSNVRKSLNWYKRQNECLSD